MTKLTDPIFHNEAKARAHLEKMLWPDGPVCPHCGVVGEATLLKGKSTRPGVYKCRACQKPFSVTVGTVFERSKIPLHKWLMATHLMCASKKGISALQLHRTLGFGSYRTAWFMAHRIREAMREFKPAGGLGGKNKVVEADETFVGGKAKNAKRGAPVPKKEVVVSLVERDGSVRSFHLPEVTAKTLRPILVTQIDRKSYLMTDGNRAYIAIGREYVGHGSVNHSIEEYVRGGFWHTNTVEGYFSILKRGVFGTFHHVSQQHLKRYLGEFDFRYTYRQSLGYSDTDRAGKALKGITGKRLTYRRSDEAAHA